MTNRRSRFSAQSLKDCLLTVHRYCWRNQLNCFLSQHFVLRVAVLSSSTGTTVALCWILPVLSCLQELEEFFEVMTRNPKCSEVFIDFVEGSLLNLPREGSFLEPSVRAVQLFTWKMKWIPTDLQNSWEIQTFLIIRMRSMYDFQNFLS